MKKTEKYMQLKDVDKMQAKNMGILKNKKPNVVFTGCYNASRSLSFPSCG